MVRRGVCLLACVAASSCGGAALGEGDVSVMPDRAYVFDLGDRMVASAYVRVTAGASSPEVAWDVKVVWEDIGPSGRLLPCPGYAGFAMDDGSDPRVALEPGETRDMYVRASAGTLLACSGGRAVTCGEPLTLLLVPRGVGPSVRIPATADCFFGLP